MHNVSKTTASVEETKSKKHEHQFESDGHGTSNASHAIDVEDGWFNGYCHQGWGCTKYV
jgi:hypothetical protein